MFLYFAKYFFKRHYQANLRNFKCWKQPGKNRASHLLILSIFSVTCPTSTIKLGVFRFICAQVLISGGSDDIGDISWKLPTVTLRFPANIPGLQGHHWSNAVAMATPIAHKGVVAGAKVEAMTLLDFFLQPELVEQAWEYFRNEQGMKQEYIPMVTEKDSPATYLNKDIMDTFREEMKTLYYDDTKYNTYLEQLGISYPTVKK